MTAPKTILPFRALRYNLDKISDLSQVIAPPYDVIGPAQKKQLYERSPHNIAWLDVTQEGKELPAQERYNKAAQDFKDWQAQGILSRDTDAGLYVYEQEFTAPDGTRYTRRGFYSLRRLEAFGKGTVYPHERTLAGPKKDRLSLMKATDTHMSPIFSLFHEPSGQANALLAKAVNEEPLFDFADDNEQRHSLWAVTDPAWIEEMQAAVQASSFLIADGHHRYETAMAYAAWRDETNPSDLSHYVLMFCESVDDPGLLVLPTHRIVHDRPNFSAPDFMAKLRDFFAVEEYSDEAEWLKSVHAGQDQSEHTFGLSIPGDAKRYIARIQSDALSTVPALQKVDEPLRSLDAAILHKCFLEDFLGFTAADQGNTDYINYLKSDAAFLKQMQEAGSQLGIMMNAAALPQIRTVAEAGQFMPPKTTFFYPKLPTGLVINYID